MQANTLTPKRLFEQQVRYVIPVFQRPYVWKIEKQWEPLWDDVRAVAEEVLDAQVDGADIGSVPPHFLGAVVLDQQPTPAGFIAVRYVIDGQQRLITLQLLLNATRQVAIAHGRPKDAAQLETLVNNPEDIIDHVDERLKVWPIAPDRTAFQAAMDTDSTNDLGDHLIRQAIVFLRHRIRNWALHGPHDVEPADRIHALTRALTMNLKVVVIDLEPGDNAQAIFEALNDRGSPLLAVDLIKNAVFQAAEREGLDAEKLNQDYWAPLDDPYWRRVLRQGRLNRPRIDIFLNYWLTMRRAHAVPSDRIFTDFRDHILKDAPDVRPVLEQLVSDSRCYRELAIQPPHSTAGTFYYRVIECMDIAATTPLLLWLMRSASAVPETARDVALRAIESWLVRRMLCRITLSDTNSIVVELLAQLCVADPAEAGTITSSFLAGQAGESRRWPTDHEVVESTSAIRFYNVLVPRRRVRMVLEGLEDDLRTPKTEDRYCPRGVLTIEHVMPQSWRTYWGSDIEEDEEAARQRDRAVQTLGNLTLLTSKLNPAAAHYPWLSSPGADDTLPSKRDLLYEHTTLLLNKRLLDGHPDRWMEKDIEARSVALAEQITRIWSRPQQA